VGNLFHDINISNPFSGKNNKIGPDPNKTLGGNEKLKALSDGGPKVHPNQNNRFNNRLNTTQGSFEKEQMKMQASNMSYQSIMSALSMVQNYAAADTDIAKTGASNVQASAASR